MKKCIKSHNYLPLNCYSAHFQVCFTHDMAKYNVLVARQVTLCLWDFRRLLLLLLLLRCFLARPSPEIISQLEGRAGKKLDMFNPHYCVGRSTEGDACLHINMIFFSNQISLFIDD